MTKIVSMGFGALLLLFSTNGLAQMSTFPSPPPLPPPASAPPPASQSPNTPSTPTPVPEHATSVDPAPLTPTPLTPETLAPSGTMPTSSGTETPPGTESNSNGTTATTSANPHPGSAGDIVPVSAQTLNSMTMLDDKVTLKPGDRISFRVVEDRDAAIPSIVTDTGEVDFPYIGRLKVEGHTCREVAQNLKRMLEVDYYKQATVIVGLDVIAGQITPKQVAWVAGQIHQPGFFELLPEQPTTVSQMILRAGGFGDYADQRKVKLIHRTLSSDGGGAPHFISGDEQVVDVKAVFDGESKVDPIVKPDDLVIVPKRGIIW